ncbi:MAG: UDP-N-acetylglucosamine--N-acetylmuramyl-(pentapeptide) pyrophosphoryl-undecaprenol N-acetylglucosamine transferase, partial [Candidatus Omnitrophica bacterium]|nr:UDP-N-acetylglucosamine--N-acetylmuramyl-(pentapeptide) pyrophosphoryl-undecaprenol N-acetylglucosamine transferase [Candidatus Omnitrophota bacterium]
MKLLVACGGTAGHFLPALSFLESLKKKSAVWDIRVVLTKRKIEQKLRLDDYKVSQLSLVPMNLDISFKNLVAFLKFFLGSLESLWIILSFNPRIVVGFGGYASFPVVFLATILGKKSIIHEQNVSPGITNKFLAHFVDRVAVSFPESIELFNCRRDKIILTGNPIRCDLKKLEKGTALEYFNFSKDKFTILVMGGSQGSHKINMEFIEGLGALNLDNILQIIHLCGSQDYPYLKDAYQKMKYNVRLFPFLKEMKFAYSAS